MSNSTIYTDMLSGRYGYYRVRRASDQERKHLRHRHLYVAGCRQEDRTVVFQYFTSKEKAYQWLALMDL